MAALKTSVNKAETFQTLIDQPDDSTTYVGVAKRGAATSAALWQISRILATGTVTAIQYASGSDGFNQVWDLRSSLSYL